MKVDSKRMDGLPTLTTRGNHAESDSSPTAVDIGKRRHIHTVVGTALGLADGCTVGVVVGTALGSAEGMPEGADVGPVVGGVVGA